MAKLLEHRRAIRLRKHGKSYSQIRDILRVSKGTLSVWLRDYPLSKEQLRKLTAVNEVRIERFRKTMKEKRDARMQKYYREQKKKWMPLSDKELFIAGLFLYWGEGSKADRYHVFINNTDPQVVKFTLYWMVRCLMIPKNKIRVNLHLYSDMDVEKEIRFWCRELNVSKKSFTKPYIKQSKRADLDQKGLFGHGTCGIGFSKTEIKERILMAIKVIADHYEAKVVKL